MMICYIIIGSFDPSASNWEVLILSSQLVLLLMHSMVPTVPFAGLPQKRFQLRYWLWNSTALDWIKIFILA